jgi:predicted ATPase/class 3 adenylate cyclase
MERAPEGTIALLFTDIEGSTRLAAQLGPAWATVLADHHALVGGAIAAEDGFVDGIEGDAFFATFADAAAAARAAVAALRGLRAHAWPDGVGELGVRMGLHVGHVERHPTGYVGLELHRAARVASAAHGGQLLLTGTARTLIGDVIASEPVGAHRLKDFPAPEPLFCAVVDGRGAAAFPPPRTQQVRPNNLPAGGPQLVGRDDDLGRVRAALLDDGERLVTITGRGGSGKTSLALVAAAGLLDEHPGGVWLTRLASATAPEDVLAALAAAVGAESEDSPAEAIADRLRDRGTTLAVLDNLEHLLPAAADVQRLLEALPGLRVLATSQAPLRLAAERIVPLDALDDDAALALIERVARRRGTVAPDDRDALLDVVHLLDGLPLALELAAARLALLSPAQLRERLRESPDVLKDSGGDRLARHRSLRATVEWTLSLLDDAPRALFNRMGAFAGPVELEELETVAGEDELDVLEALAGLLDVALVRRVESGDGRIRFGLPEALRQLASARLDAAPDGDRWRAAHLRRQYAIAWAARGLGQAPGADYRAALAAGEEADAALHWARAHDHPLAAPLAAARGSILAFIGRTGEAFALLEPLLAAGSGDPEVEAQVLVGQTLALMNADRLDEALATAERIVALDADQTTRARGYLVRGIVHGATDPEAALRDHERATAIGRALGPAFHAGVLAIEAMDRLAVGDLDGAAAQLDEAERIGRPLDVVRLWQCHSFHGEIAMRSGRPEEALGHYERALEAAQATRNDVQMLFDLLSTGHVLAVLGRDDDALEVIGLAEALGADIGRSDASTFEGWFAPDHIEHLAAVEARVGAEAAAALRARGRAVPPGGRVTRATQLAAAARA